MRGAPLFAFPLAFLVIGCGANKDQLRYRAAYDFRCAERQLELVELDDRTIAVRGCGQDAVYIEVCQPSAFGKSCTWATDARTRPVYYPPGYPPPGYPPPGYPPPGYPPPGYPSPGYPPPAVAPPPSAAPRSGASSFDAKSGALLARIPGKKFTMGHVGVAADERPVRLVELAPFAIDVLEVSVAGYAACVKAGACSAAGNARGCNGAENAKHPVNCVSAQQAEVFCAWGGGRLPTEAEWEYAARGSDGRAYPWGSADPGAQVCWGQWTRRDATCEVGSFPAGVSPFGVLDMAGNVLEWTASAYCAYDVPNCEEKKRVARGGAYGTSVGTLRAAKRTPLAPDTKSPLVGFRCVHPPTADTTAPGPGVQL